MSEEVYEQIKLYKKVDWMKLVHQYFDDLSYTDKAWKYT